MLPARDTRLDIRRFRPNGYWTSTSRTMFAGAASSVGGYCVNFAVTPPDLTISEVSYGQFQASSERSDILDKGDEQRSWFFARNSDGGGHAPAGLTATISKEQDGPARWRLCGATRTDALNSGASYPDITLTVNVSGTAPGTVTNSATVSGGGDGHPVTIRLPIRHHCAGSDMTVTKTHVGNFTQGQRALTRSRPELGRRSNRGHGHGGG